MLKPKDETTTTAVVSLDERDSKLKTMTDVDKLLDERTVGGGEYPDWWEPEDEGDMIQGEVLDMRENPWAEDDEDAGFIIEVDAEEQVYSTRTQTMLMNLIDERGVEVGDLVRIEYGGMVKTNSGHAANSYKMGVVKADELDETESEATPDGGIPQEAIDFLNSIVEFKGEVTPEEAREQLNNVRDFDVDVHAVADEAGVDLA